MGAQNPKSRRSAQGVNEPWPSHSFHPCARFPVVQLMRTASAPAAQRSVSFTMPTLGTDDLSSNASHRSSAMSEKEQIDRFCAELDALIHRYRSEYDITYSSVIGCLHMTAHDLCVEASDASD